MISRSNCEGLDEKPDERLPPQILGDDLRFAHSVLKVKQYVRAKSSVLRLKGELIPLRSSALISTRLSGGATKKSALNSNELKFESPDEIMYHVMAVRYTVVMLSTNRLSKN